ncbi:hypothetical protein [Haloarchaeobius sp. FL176]|uniref:hypothetical protein n=1 Tax=Haloarchaeobius sp. FL176 TaxID=2967129 RepID=UPI002148185C|nr:hypothetical protein [Haloarchaeobius sp. FL176]
MVTGLDFCTDRLRVATGDPDDPTLTDAPALVATVGADALADTGLSLDELAHAERDGTVYVVGEDANRVADATRATAEPLFVREVLAAREGAGEALAALVESVAGDDPGRACYTSPGTVVEADLPTETHRGVVADALEAAGFDATPIHTGLATLYGAADDDGYTGLGVAVRPESTAVCLSYYGVPVVAFSLPTGTEDLVARAADAADAGESDVRVALSAFSLGPDTKAGGVEGALAEAYDGLVADLLDRLGHEADEGDVRPGVAAPVVLAGEGAVPGLELLLGGRLDDSAVPVSVDSVRRAADPVTCPVRGALAAAEADVDAYEAVAWSETGSPETDDGSGNGGASMAATGGSAETAPADGRTGGQSPEDDSANRAIDQMFERLGKRDDELAEVQAAVDELAARVDDLRAEAALATDLADVTDQLDDVAADLSALDDRAAAGTDVEQLAERVDDLSADLDEATEDATDRIGDLERRTNLNGSLLEDLREDLDDSAEELSALTDRLADLDDRTVDVSAHDALDSQVEEVAADLDGLGTMLDGVADELAELRLDLTADLDAVEDALDATGEDLAALRAESADAERVDALAARLDELDGSLGELRDDVDAVDDEVADVAARVDGVAAQVDDVDDGIAAVEDRVDAVEDHVGGVADDLGTVRERVDGVDDRLDETEADVQSVDARVAEVAERVDSLGSDHGELTGRVDGLAARLDDIEARDVASTEDLAALRADVSDQREVVDEIRSELSAVQADADGMDERLESLAREVETVEDEVATVAAESVDPSEHESLAEQVGDVQDRVDELTEALEDTGDDELAERAGELEARVDGLEDRVEEAARFSDRLDSVEERVESDDEDGEAATAARSSAVAAGIVSGATVAGVVGLVGAVTGPMGGGLAGVAIAVVVGAAVLLR